MITRMGGFRLSILCETEGDISVILIKVKWDINVIKGPKRPMRPKVTII